MAEYNVVCVNCTHGPHANKECTNCKCTEFERYEPAVASRLMIMNNNLYQLIQESNYHLASIASLLGLAYPDAKATLDAQIKELVEKRRAAEAEARDKRAADIEAAYNDAITAADAKPDVSSVIREFPVPPNADIFHRES